MFSFFFVLLTHVNSKAVFKLICLCIFVLVKQYKYIKKTHLIHTAKPFILQHSIRTLLFYIFFIVSFQQVMAQSIIGNVVDEENLPLEFVSVALLQPRDSLLIKYTSTGSNGEFELNDVKENTYLLQIYLMTYKADQRTIAVSEKQYKQDTIQLKREVNALDEVVISAVIPIKIKQDTMSFNPKAFKVRKDDNVGELIKKLPGIEVEADGTVNVQGQQITKILVDGKEFFLGDPQIVLQNLSADALESVEVIDQSSDDERVSGVRDGEKHKVLNLVLKDNKKVGFFGKAAGGYGTNDRYMGKFDVNSFTKKTQLAVFGNLNNINNSSATIFERDGTKGNPRKGFVTTGVAGVNYNYELKEDFNFNLDYYYNYTKNNQATKADRTEFSNQGDLDSEIENLSESISNNQNLNFSLRDRSKKGAYLLLRGNFKNDDRTQETANRTIYLDDDDNEDTSSDRITHSEDDRGNGGLTFSYRKKMNEKGRNFRFNSGLKFQDYFDNDNQISVNEYYLSDPDKYEKSTELTNRDSNNESVRFNFSFRYMEPILKNHFLSLTSAINNNVTDFDLEEIKIVNEELQDPFTYDQHYFLKSYDNSLGYNFSSKKIQVSLSAVYDIKKQSLDLEEESLVDKEYKTVLPRFSFNYRYKRGNYFTLNYTKSLRLAGAYQLSPVVNDFNPLRISFGNPDLTPSKIDAFNARLYTHSFKSANSFFANIKYAKTSNAIVSKRIFGEKRVRYSTYENYGDKNLFTTYLHFSRRISKLGMRYAVKLRGNLNDRTSIIGDEYNKAVTKGSALGLSFSNINKNLMDFTLGANLDLKNTTYSLQETENTTFEQVYFAKYDWDISNNLNFNSQFKYTLYSDSNFDSQAIPIWNLAVEYVFMSGKEGLLKFQVIDVLNKDVGVRINSNADYYEESFSKNLGMYAMLSFTYSIKPTMKKKSKRIS